MKLVFNSGAALFVFSCLLVCSPFCEEGHAETAQATTLTEKVRPTKNTKGRETAKIIAAVAKDGAKLNVKAQNLDYSAVELSGEGFKPYESLHLVSTSCHESLQFRVAADKHGKLLPMGLLPAVIGQLGGMCHIDILREAGSIQIEFPWGAEVLKVSLRKMAEAMAELGPAAATQ